MSILRGYKFWYRHFVCTLLKKSVQHLETGLLVKLMLFIRKMFQSGIYLVCHDYDVCFRGRKRFVSEGDGGKIKEAV